MSKSKRRGGKKLVISQDQLLRMMKKVNRDIALETPHIRGGAHKTHKKDKIRNNTVQHPLDFE